MHIEVLFVPGCPNHEPAVERLRKVLSCEAIEASIQEIAVTDEAMARLLRFPGSPTVRIDGQDAEPNGQLCFGISCRLYADGSGLPSEETLQHAISTPKKREEGV